MGDDRPLRLGGRAAIVTGGASGIGRAIVDRYVEEGARVGVLDRSDVGLARVCERHGDAVITVAGDVRDLTAHEQVVARTVGAFGRLDMLVAAAGIVDLGALGDVPRERLTDVFDEVMGVNLKGYLLAAVAARQRLADSNGGIAMVLSTASRYPGGGGVMYTMSKHAAVGLVRHLAVEFAPHVRVNGVALAGVRGSDIRGPDALGQGGATAQYPREALAERMSPLGFLPEDRQYTGIFVLLADPDDAAVATGSIIAWDTGVGALGHPLALMKRRP